MNKVRHLAVNNTAPLLLPFSDCRRLWSRSIFLRLLWIARSIYKSMTAVAATAIVYYALVLTQFHSGYQYPVSDVSTQLNATPILGQLHNRVFSPDHTSSKLCILVISQYASFAQWVANPHCMHAATLCGIFCSLLVILVRVASA